MKRNFWKIGKPVIIISAAGLLIGGLRRHLKQLHGHSHSHETQSAQTEGVTIHWAKWYDPLVNLLALGQAQKIRNMTVEMAGIQPGQTVLDVGCGTGDLTLAAKKAVGQDGSVTGIDAAAEMIAVATDKAHKQQLAIDFQIAPIEKLPFADNSFDMVINSLVMHHLPEHVKRDGIAEIYRVLRPDGTFFTLDFVPMQRKSERLRTLHFGHRSGPSSSIFDLEHVLEENGFEDVESGHSPVRLLGHLRGKKPQA
ncbi:MAG: methyltransferase domain-containing protein [Chloroflexi bacterium]|nr:MAG: methyltransferase domain-containing protein [Chloroflexota bacterium]